MKIVSPSFNLDYGLDINQIENKLKKINKVYEIQIKIKRQFLFLRGGF